MFVAYQIVNILPFFFNCHNQLLPYISSVSLYTSLLSFFIISLVVVICSRGNYQSAHFVFIEFSNGNDGLLVQLHLLWDWSIQISHSQVWIVPRRSSETRTSNSYCSYGNCSHWVCDSFCYSLAMFFSIRNLDQILNSTTGVPILNVFYQSSNYSIPGALCLESLIGVDCIWMQCSFSHLASSIMLVVCSRWRSMGVKVLE